MSQKGAKLYHISSDKRAVKSAELIWQGLKACLQEKELKKIRIADINEKCYVSRATFYRLFDSVEDVLIYQCDRIFNELDTEHFASTRDYFLFLIARCLEERVLLKALVENNLSGILYDAQMRHNDLMKRVFLRNAALRESEADYLVSILTNIVPAVMNTWYTHGQTETPEEILAIAKRSMTIISEVLDK